MSTSNNNFNQLAKAKTPPPFSLRFTFDERAKLEEAANGVPLGSYIKAVLFGQDLQKVRRRNTNPIKDHAALAQVLGVLGQSRLAQNVNQMAKAVHAGALPVNPDTEADLDRACEDIRAMRHALIEALGLESEGP